MEEKPTSTSCSSDPSTKDFGHQAEEMCGTPSTPGSDPLGAAKGIIWGTCFGVVFWLILGFGLWYFLAGTK